MSLILIAHSYGLSQENNVLWQKSFGGDGDDHISAMTEDDNGAIYIATTIQSVSNYDILLSKVDPNGITIWNKIIGGSKDEIAYSIDIDQQGQIVLLASSKSSPDFLETPKGYEDIVLMRYSTQGVLISKQNYGGSFIDIPASLLVNKAGNVVITGYSRSNDGDLASNYGQYDIFVFEVNQNNEIIWSETFGGDDEDISHKIIELADGGYMILGQSSSYNGAYSDNMGDYDVLLIKIDALGNKEWQSSYGGGLSDLAADMVQLTTGNIVVAANTFSSTYDVSINHGGSDAWLFEVDINGQMSWERTYGSYANESISALVKTGVGFMLIGTSNSTTLASSSNNGEQDLWLYEIDETSKDITNEVLLGSSGFDSGKAILIQQDGSIILGGSTNSNDGLVTDNKGKKDGWLLSLSNFLDKRVEETLVHPNPSTGLFYLNQLPANATIQVIDQRGNIVVSSSEVSSLSTTVDLSQMPGGIYIVQIDSSERKEAKRIVKL